MKWRKVKLKDVCTLLNGYAFKSKKYIENGIRVIRITNVQKGYMTDPNPKFYANDPKIEDYKLFENDILISLTGNVGRVALLEKQFLPAVLNQRVGCLRIKNKAEINLKYLYWILNRGTFERDCLKNSKGVAQKNLSTNWIKNVEIPLPPMNIQIKIINALDKAQELINNRKTQIENYDELLQSVFLDMFGDPVINSKEWKIKKLGEMGKLKNGLNYKEKKSGQKINFLGVGEFKKGTYLNSTKLLPKLELDTLPSKDYLLKDSDLIFVRSNGSKELVGRSILINKADVNTTFSGFCIRYRNDSSDLEMRFFRSLLEVKSFKIYLKKDSRGANINNLNQKMLANLEIILPPLHLQNQFASICEKVEMEKKKMEDSLAELENNFNSIMQRAFKGDLF